MALESGGEATAKRLRLRLRLRPPADEDPKPNQRDAAAAVDRISALPEVLRLLVLADLPLKSAIRTGALSREWRGLWEQRWQDDSNPSSLHYCLLPVSAGPSPKREALLQSLEQRGGRRLDRLSLVVELRAMSTKLLRKCLDCAAGCAVEDLRVEVRLPAPAAKRAFHFPASSATLAHLSLRGVVVSGLRCKAPQPFSFLEVLRLHSVHINDWGLARMLALCPSLAVLGLYCCSDLRKINLTAAAGPNLRSLTVAGCRDVKAVDVVPVSSLRSFRYSGDFIPAFHLPDDASFADLYICFRGVPRSPDALICNKVFSEKFSNTLLRNGSKLTALTICSNVLCALSSLPNAIAHAESAKTGGFFPSMTELQLLMLEMKAADLRNIYVFLKNSHCSNLERLFVQLPTIPGASLVRWLDYVWEKPPEDGLENLKVVKIMNFKWRHVEVQLVHFLLRKASSLRTMLLDSPNLVPLDVPGIQKEDLSLLRDAVANGQIILSESDDAATQPFHADVFAEF